MKIQSVEETVKESNDELTQKIYDENKEKLSNASILQSLIEGTSLKPKDIPQDLIDIAKVHAFLGLYIEEKQEAN